MSRVKGFCFLVVCTRRRGSKVLVSWLYVLDVPGERVLFSLVERIRRPSLLRPLLYVLDVPGEMFVSLYVIDVLVCCNPGCTY